MLKCLYTAILSKNIKQKKKNEFSLWFRQFSLKYLAAREKNRGHIKLICPLFYVLSLINPRMCTYANIVAYSYLIYNNGILR